MYSKNQHWQGCMYLVLLTATHPIATHAMMKQDHIMKPSVLHFCIDRRVCIPYSGRDSLNDPSFPSPSASNFPAPPGLENKLSRIPAVTFGRQNGNMLLRPLMAVMVAQPAPNAMTLWSL